MTFVDDIQAIVNSVLGTEQFGTTMAILKYIGKQTNSELNPYNYSQAKFSASVEVAGRVTLNPTPEIISKYGGNTKKYDAMFVWSTIELSDKFPDVELTWVTTSDRVVYGGNTYLLNLVKPSGMLNSTYTLVVAFGNTEKGATLNGP